MTILQFTKCKPRPQPDEKPQQLIQSPQKIQASNKSTRLSQRLPKLGFHLSASKIQCENSKKDEKMIWKILLGIHHTYRSLIDGKRGERRRTNLPAVAMSAGGANQARLRRVMARRKALVGSGARARWDAREECVLGRGDGERRAMEEHLATTASKPASKQCPVFADSLGSWTWWMNESLFDECRRVCLKRRQRSVSIADDVSREPYIQDLYRLKYI